MDSEIDTSADSASPPPVMGAGAQLRAAREARRLELAQVAAETRIPVRHLEAIEAGDFESLPSRAYAIGFARTYAKAVGLDDGAITDVVRGELADGSMRRVVPSSAMEPGDPARLPSSGLAWAGVAAALVLAVGAFAFFNSYFGAGDEPGSLLTPETQAPPVASAAPAPEAPAAGGEVVLTALEDNVWLRLYEEGGDRLIERTLKRGETVLVPADATDPRLNTGRPDALAITVGGKPVAKLAETPSTVSSAPVSAAALLGRGTPIAAGSDVAVADNPAALPLSAPRRAASEARLPAAAPTVPEPSPAAATAAAASTATTQLPETAATDN
jgi:cytoskeletal protein RodZ